MMLASSCRCGGGTLVSGGRTPPERYPASSTPALMSETAYPARTRMGLLAPGLLKAGDVPHLTALLAPRTVVVAGGLDAAGKALEQKGLDAAFAFTTKTYELLKTGKSLTLKAAAKASEVAEKLA